MKQHTQHLVIHDDFYGQGLLDSNLMLLDYRKYKGRGRPRRTDYSTLIEIHNYLNKIINKHIETHTKVLGDSYDSAIREALVN